MKYTHLTEVLDLQTLTLVKLSLDREGLSYRVLFEHSLYVGAYLLGNRGAVIQVKEVDYPAAVRVLEMEHIPVDAPTSSLPFGRLHELELLTESLPLVGRWNVTLRFLALALLVAGLVSMLIYRVALG